MSDPRAVISRTVLAPPTPAAKATLTTAAVEPDMRLIGKPHGRMRCVNLSLTIEAKQALYAKAHKDGLTLGEALMDVVDQSSVPATRRRPGRQGQLRRGVTTTSVYVLLVPAEAADLVARSNAAGRSVSDYVSRALTT